MAAKIVSAVVMQRICEVQAVHRSRQHRVADTHDQVVVGLHEAVGNAVPVGNPRHLGETPKELESIDVISVESRRRPHTQCVYTWKSPAEASRLFGVIARPQACCTARNATVTA